MTYSIPIMQITELTHDVKQFSLRRPDNFTFVAGQATEVSIDEDGWIHEKRPFTFTSHPDDKNIEFIIKTYRDHNGVTNKINQLKIGDHLLIGDPWGTIKYKGKGFFLAGGAGITPFISIFRSLKRSGNLFGNSLIYANKSEDDIILRDELEDLLGENFINVITSYNKEITISKRLNFLPGFIDRNYLESKIKNFDQNFYVCGPPAFNNSMVKYLTELGASPNALTFEM